MKLREIPEGVEEWVIIGLVLGGIYLLYKIYQFMSGAVDGVKHTWNEAVQKVEDAGGAVSDSINASEGGSEEDANAANDLYNLFFSPDKFIAGALNPAAKNNGAKSFNDLTDQNPPELVPSLSDNSAPATPIITIPSYTYAP